MVAACTKPRLCAVVGTPSPCLSAEAGAKRLQTRTAKAWPPLVCGHHCAFDLFLIFPAQFAPFLENQAFSFFAKV